MSYSSIPWLLPYAPHPQCPLLTLHPHCPYSSPVLFTASLNLLYLVTMYTLLPSPIHSLSILTYICVGSSAYPARPVEQPHRTWPTGIAHGTCPAHCPGKKVIKFHKVRWKWDGHTFWYAQWLNVSANRLLEEHTHWSELHASASCVSCVHDTW